MRIGILGTGYLLLWTRTMPGVGTELFDIKVVK